MWLIIALLPTGPLKYQPIPFKSMVYSGRSGGMVDAADSKSATCEGVGVQVPSPV